MPTSPLRPCRAIELATGAPVAALGDIACVPRRFISSAQACTRSGPNRCRSAFRKAVARQGRDHDVEGVLGAAACALGSVSGPMILSCSMTEPGHPCDDERKRILMTRTDVDEVDVDPVYAGDELRKRFSFASAAPIVAVAPIPNQPCKVQRHALRRIVSLSGQRVAAMRRRRSSSAVAAPDFEGLSGGLRPTGRGPGRKGAQPECQQGSQVEPHGRTSLPGEWNVTVCPVKTLPSASTSSISTLCSPRGMPTRMTVLL